MSAVSGPKSSWGTWVRGTLSKSNLTNKQLCKELEIPEYQFYRWARRGSSGPPEELQERIEDWIAKRADADDRRRATLDREVSEPADVRDRVGAVLHRLRTEEAETIEFPLAARLIADMAGAMKGLEDRLAELELILENTKDVVWVADMGARFRRHSAGVLGLVGCSPEELDGRHVTSVLAPESRKLGGKRLRLAYDKAVETGDFNQTDRLFAKAMHKKTGETLYLEIRGGFLTDRLGLPKGLFGITRDATDLIKFQKKLGTALLNEDWGHAVVDAEGIYRSVGTKFAHLLGYEIHELLGRHYLDLTAPEDRDESERRYNQCKTMVELGGYDFEKRYIRKDGSLLAAEVSVYPPVPFQLEPEGWGVICMVRQAVPKTDDSLSV